MAKKEKKERYLAKKRIYFHYFSLYYLPKNLKVEFAEENHYFYYSIMSSIPSVPKKLHLPNVRNYVYKVG